MKDVQKIIPENSLMPKLSRAVFSFVQKP